MKVSVITTLYNYRSYIADAIKSFLKQSLQDSEMIIVDDASTDFPMDVIQPFISERVKYVRLENNKGYSHAKNVGISMSDSEILVMLDADDMLTDTSLERRYKKIMDGYDLVHGPALDLKVGDTSSMPVSSLWTKWLKSKKDANCYKYIHAQTVMIRKDVHRKIGLYDESLRFKSDREMWARVMSHNLKVGWVDEPVSIYRIHSKQMHKSKEKARINDVLQAEVLTKIARRSKDLSDVIMLP